MTIWNIQKLYTDNGSIYEAIPYNFFSTMRSTLKMKNGIKQVIKFLANSRWSEKSAKSVCNRKNL